MINKNLLHATFSFLKLRFRHRKIIHYTLLGFIIFLQVFAVVIWYNETISDTGMDKALKSMDYWNKISDLRFRINKSFVNSQNDFNNYNADKDLASLAKYRASYVEISRLIDSLSLASKENRELENILTEKKLSQSQIIELKSKLEEIVKLSRNENPKLKELNINVLKLHSKTMRIYTESLNVLQSKTEKQLQKQYKRNKVVRSYALNIFRALMIVVSLAILYFTRAAFQYEKKLTLTKNKIKESLNFKNRIMGMISHEIRSPLSILAIYSKMIASSIKDAEMKETFQSIQFTTNSLLLLANQILEYSKDENRLLELNSDRFRLKCEIHQIVTSMGSLVECKGNRLDVVSNLPDLEVFSDPVKIHQLFYNIIGNANKFTKDGVIVVSMDVEKVGDEKINFKVSIEDNGYGISENDLENIFERYYQGTVSGKVNDLGAGLGLNLCKEIIELFGGSIIVQSDKGKGTKVEFNLFLNIV